MPSDETDPTDHIRRREVLQAGIAMPALAAGIPAPSLDRQTRIVTDRAGKHQDAVQTRKVPKKWLRHEEEIRRTNRALAKSLGGRDAVLGVLIGASDRTTEGLNYAQQQVLVDSTIPSRKRESLPQSLSEAGISYSELATVDDSIRLIEEDPNPEPMAGTCAGYVAPDPFPGGCSIRGQNPNQGGYGTSGYRMSKDGGGEVITAANHVFIDSCDLSSDTVLATKTNEEIGPIVAGHKNHDWVAIKPSSTDIDDIANSIYREGKTTLPIGGYKTDNGLAAIKGDSNAVEKMGISTGIEQGTLTGYNKTNATQDLCTRLDTQGVKVDIDGAKGDSGGPMYATEYDYDYSDGNGGEYASIIANALFYTGSNVGTTCNNRDIKPTVWGFATNTIINNNPYYIPRW